jgi:hypothetical protein
VELTYIASLPQFNYKNPNKNVEPGYVRLQINGKIVEKISLPVS